VSWQLREAHGVLSQMKDECRSAIHILGDLRDPKTIAETRKFYANHMRRQLAFAARRRLVAMKHDRDRRLMEKNSAGRIEIRSASPMLCAKGPSDRSPALSTVQ